jgi:WD40 repeat protein
VARVFLSHSSCDNEAAAKLKAWLDSQGFAPAFLDFDKQSGIPPGSDWQHKLQEQIELCQALLILQTPNWVKSNWCFFEYHQARLLGKEIFQVVVSDEGAAEQPIAADLQRLDLRSDQEAGLEQLRGELQRIALEDEGGFVWPPPSYPSRSPFPGLMVFEEVDAAVFYGRNDDCKAVIRRLNTRRMQQGPRLLVLQGASGSGKSSLLRAGVLPRLQRAGRQWLVLPVFRPGERPLKALAEALAVALKQPEHWQELLEQLQSTKERSDLAKLFDYWATHLRLVAGSPDAQLMLPIDQAEELFTVADEAERKVFLNVLAALLHHRLPLQALMTIRADAMSSLQNRQELVNCLELVPLGPLLLDRYEEIIKGPARKAGIVVEEAFVKRAIRDIGKEDALPLLAFALQQLYENSGMKALTLIGYEALGDKDANLSPLENAVKKAADDVLKAKNPDELGWKALRDAFIPAMVRVTNQGYARRAAEWDALPKRALPLLEALVEARLLVVRQDEVHPKTVEVAHEALLRVWPELRGWLEDSRDFLLCSQQLDAELSHYNDAPPAQKNQALLSGLKLEKGRTLLRERHDQLKPDHRDYIISSLQYVDRQKLFWRIFLVGIFIVVLLALIVAGIQLISAKHQRGEALVATAELTIASRPADALIETLAAPAFADYEKVFGRNTPTVSAASARVLIEGTVYNREYNRYVGHDKEVRTAEFSPDGKLIVSASEDGSIRLWDIQSGQAIGEPLIAHDGDVWSASFSKDGKRIVSAGKDGTIRLWDVQSLFRLPYPSMDIIRGHTGEVLSAAFRSDGKQIVSSGKDGTIRIWDADTGLAIGQPLRGHDGWVWTAAFSKDGKRIVSGGEDGTVRIWDASSGQAIGIPLKKHNGWVKSAVFSQDGLRIVSAGFDGIVRIWDARSGRLISRLRGHHGWIKTASFDNDDKNIVSAGQDGMRLWDAGKGLEVPNFFRGHQGWVMSASFSPDGTQIVSAGHDKTIRLWSIKNDVSIGKPLRGHQASVRSVAIGSNGQIVSSGDDATVRIWNHKIGLEIKPPMRGHDGPVRSVDIKVDLKRIVSSGEDGTIRIWDADSGQPIGEPINAHADWVHTVMFSEADDLIVSAGEDATVRLWDGLSGQSIGVPMQGHQGPVLSAAFSTDGKQIVSTGVDGTVRTWDTATGHQIGEPLIGHRGWVRSAAFSDNGSRIVSAGDDETIRVWDVKTGQAIGEPLRGHVGAVRSVVFRKKQSQILSAGEDGTIRIWDALSGRPIGEPLRGHIGTVYSAKYLDEGNLIVSGGQDGTVRLWDLAWTNPIRVACQSLRYHQALASPATELQRKAASICKRHG